jgi:AraC-like DNA-binding protein
MGTELVPTDETVDEHEIERRAGCQSLTDSDRTALRRAKAIHAGLARNLSISDIAREMGTVSRSVLSRFAGSELYLACVRILSKDATILNHEDADAAILKAKHLLAVTLPDAVEYLRSCLAKDVTTGKPEDPGLAQWATQELLKLGALKTDGASMVGTAIITAEAMQTLLGAIRGDDKKRETHVTVTVEPTHA